MMVMAALGATLVTGGWLVGRGFQGDAPDVHDRARLFQSVLDHVSRYYVDSIGAPVLYQKAVDGLLEELNDPYTAFLTAERLQKLTERTTGNYAGLGLRVDQRDGWITVIDPIPGGPAERAGIQAGDRIVEVRGQSTEKWTTEEAVSALRGEPASTVSFVIARPGVEARIPFTLAREEVHLRSVQRVAMLRDGAGYLDVSVFSEATAAEVRQAMDSLQRLGARSVIVDLRGNPGGLLDQGVSVSDLFLDPGQEIVRMKGRTPEANHTFVDAAPQRWPSVPLSVLVDEGSASASEIVAGALQDHDRALVIGSTSYGKGSAQSLIPMRGGGALKLTTALWFTPSGRSINKPLPSDEDAESESDESTVLPRIPAGDSTGKTVAREKFRTDAQRVVYGGGGITPDLLAGDTLPDRGELAFSRALGGRLTAFRDALTEYALALKVGRTLTSPRFEVTPAMRDEFWSRLQRRGVTVDRAVYDSAAGLVSRQLGYEIARFAFGPEAEFRRRAADDEAITTALDLMRDATSQRDLLARAAARPAAQQPSATAVVPATR
jgi:carboxyl-terminal processing protease